MFWYVLGRFFFLSNLLIPSFLMSDVIESLRLLTKNERCEQIPHVPHQKWVTKSESLRSLTKNERIVHFLSESLVGSFAKNEMKTDEQIPSPNPLSQY